MLKLEAAPQTLVDPQGAVRFGVFGAPLADADLSAARFSLPALGLPAPPLWRRLRLKQWQHFCIVAPGALITFAVVDTGYLSVGWCQFVDLETGERFEHAHRAPPGRASVARALLSDRTALHLGDFAIEVRNTLAEGRHTVAIDIAETAKAPALSAQLVCHHDLDAITPLVVSLPVGGGRTMYSHKVPLPVSGVVRVAGRRITLDRASAVAILDIHKAHYPHHTYWRWATFAGHDAKGRLIGLNLTKNVVEDDARYNENAVWVDGQVTRLGPAVFEHERDMMRPWRLATADGAVRLRFVPLGGRTEDLDVGVIRSRFHQLYGEFHGEIALPDGETLAIDGLHGLCEDHDARW